MKPLIYLVNAYLIISIADTNYTYNNEALQARKSDYPIHPIILSRTSPREMTGESITDAQLFTMLEAARWAPSSFNIQPWRFIYAKRDTEHWPKFFNLLTPGNKQWAKNAAVLILVASNKYNLYKGEIRPIKTHSFDTGAAWMALALEGTARGFVVHAMGGFDYDRAPDVLNIPRDTHSVECMIAIGKRPPIEARAMKEPVSQRNNISSFISVGEFNNRENY